MKHFIALLLPSLFAFTLLVTWAAPKQVIGIKVLHRQNSETEYTVTFPAQTTARAYSSDGTASASVTTVEGYTNSQQVRGATLSLLLPDGRVAVVNCKSKYVPRGDYINRRSCRIPQAVNIGAEFDGDKAKLIWVTSLDGRKQASETYRILSIIAPSAIKASQKPGSLEALPSKLQSKAEAPLADQYPFRWKSHSGAGVRVLYFNGDTITGEFIPFLMLEVGRGTYSLKRNGNGYVGLYRQRGPCTNDGPRSMVRRGDVELEVEFTLVTPNRIEGRIQMAGPDNEFDCKTYSFSKPLEWSSFIWVPE